MASPKAVRTIGPLDRPLPSAIQSEQIVLASVLLEPSCWDTVAAVLSADLFSTERHRRLYGAMGAIFERGEQLDHTSLFNEVVRRGHQEPDTLTYLVSLGRDHPHVVALDSHLATVKDRAELRRQIHIATSIIERCYASQEPAQVIAESAAQTFGKIETGKEQEGRDAEQVVLEFPGGPDCFMDPSLRPQGLRTGFHQFDNVTTGLHGNQLILIAARPSMGKTSIAMNMAHNMSVRAKHPGVVFSLEMSSSSLIARMMCAAAKVDLHSFKSGFLRSEDRRKMQESLFSITEAPLLFFDEGGMTLPRLERNVRRLVKEKKCSYVIIDYLGLLDAGGRFENKNAEVSHVTRKLKLLAKECDIPVILLCQLNRANERRTNKEPELSDLRDSGAIEQDSDVVAFIHRPEVYEPKPELRGVAYLIIRKQRDGKCDRIELTFMGNFVSFENLSHRQED